MSEYIALEGIPEVVLTHDSIDLDIRTGVAHPKHRIPNEVESEAKFVQMAVCCSTSIEDEM